MANTDIRTTSHSADSKFDSGRNLRKVKIFGIIYIESEEDLTKTIIFRRSPNG